MTHLATREYEYSMYQYVSKHAFCHGVLVPVVPKINCAAYHGDVWRA